MEIRNAGNRCEENLSCPCSPFCPCELKKNKKFIAGLHLRPLKHK